MRKFLIILLLFPFVVKAQKAEVIDEIIGVIGNEIVLKSDLESGILEASKGVGGATEEERCSVLENILYQKLLLHQSRIDSIQVADSDVSIQVNRRLEYFVQMFGSVEEFEKYYGKTTAQLKDEYFDQIKDQLLVQRMQEEVTKGVKVTPSDVLAYYKEVPPDSLPLMGEQIEYSQIVLDPAVRESERQRIIHFLDSVRMDIINGKTSMTLQAAKWSEDPGSKYKGGCYPLQRKGSFVPEYETAVFSTEEGNYTPVFASEYGYHFVKVVERRGDFYESCHILMSPKVSSTDLDNAKILLDEIYAKLLADSISFKAAAVRYSTNKDSKNQEGRVINPGTGSTKHDVADLPAEINLILMNLKPGEISEPVLVKNTDGSQAYIIYRLDGRVDAHRANILADYELFKKLTEENAKHKQSDKWINKHIASTYCQINGNYINCDFNFKWIKTHP
jgi:peptidyl-prolyl cis-trans isomerase SurA